MNEILRTGDVISHAKMLFSEFMVHNFKTRCFCKDIVKKIADVLQLETTFDNCINEVNEEDVSLFF